MNRLHLPRPELIHRPPGARHIVREARTLDDLDEVHRITHDSIVSAGYMPPQRGERIVSYPMLDPSPLTTILVAEADEGIVGTNSLALDGPRGLHTDHHFQAETDAVRAEGRRLVSSFRIATDPTWPARSSLALVMDLVKWTYFLAIHRYGFETMLCTFNPKHEGVYEKLIGARTIARRSSLGDDPIAAGAVLMRIDREAAPHRLEQDLAELAERYAAVVPADQVVWSRAAPAETARPGQGAQV